MKRLFVLLLLATGCAHGVPVPGYEARVIGASPSETARVMDIFVRRSPELFDIGPERVRNLISRCTVSYTTGVVAPSGDPGLVVTGITREVYYVTVLRNAEHTGPGDDALVHELVHVVLWAAYGNPEPGHARRWTPATDAWIQSVMDEYTRSSHATPNEHERNTLGLLPSP